MKKMLGISVSYLLFGLIVGLFFHEAAYYTNFDGKSVLGVVHGHALALGTAVFLAIPVLMQVFHLEQHKSFRLFVYTYNAGLWATLVFMTIRGLVQLFSFPISSFADHMIGGLAGISHIVLTVGIYFLFRTLFSAMKE